MNGAPYQQKKTSFVSGASDSENEYLGTTEQQADDEDSEEDYIYLKPIPKQSHSEWTPPSESTYFIPGSALLRTTSFNHKQYRSLKEMIIDVKQEYVKVSEGSRTCLVLLLQPKFQNGNNHLSALENGSTYSDRKVTFTLANDFDYPKFRKGQSLWLRMKTKISNQRTVDQM